MQRAWDLARPRAIVRSQSAALWAGWSLIVIAAVAVWVPGLDREYARLASPPEAALPALEAAHLTARAHAWYHTGLDLMFGSGAIAIGAMVLRRRPTGHLGVLAAMTLAAWGPTNGLAVESVSWEWWPSRVAGVIGWSAFAACVIEAVRLHRRVAFDDRQRVRWLLYGAAMSVVGTGVVIGSVGSAVTLPETSIDRHMSGHLLLVLAGMFFPVAMGVAWLSPRAPDPDTLIRRTLVYGALTATIVAANIGLIVAPTFFFYEDLGAAYLLSLVVAWAILVVPLQQLLQRAVNRLMYGQRDEPLAVMNELGRRLELGTPETVLSAIVETAAATLKLPAIAIEAEGDGRTLASIGESGLEPTALAIVYQGEEVGKLLAWPRARDEALHPRDLELLQLLARQAAATVHAVELTRELQRSRQQMLTGREEERRRMRRDLHDGLGPALAAIAMQADTAQALADSDPRGARELMAAVTRQAKDVVGDVRRLVYELRPPSLDELGLLGAIESVTLQQSSGALRCDIEAPSPLPRLDAAVEVAVYRIVAEAVTNVARHAGATRCVVRLGLVGDGGARQLRLTVDDDGGGIGADAVVGVGLRSMRERADELSGTFEVIRSPLGGARVAIVLPMVSD